MIVPMKKISVIGIQSLRNRTVAGLRDLGVLHIVTEAVSAESIDTYREEDALIERAMAIINLTEEKYGGELPVVEASTIPEGLDINGKRSAVLAEAKSILDLSDERTAALEAIAKTERELNRIEPWGETDYGKFQDLAGAGIDIRLYYLSPEDAVKLPEENQIVLSQNKNSVRSILVLFPGDSAPEEVESVPFPKKSISTLRAEIEKGRGTVARLDAEILARASLTSVFTEVRGEIAADLDFAIVETDMNGTDELCWTTGYAPTETVPSLQKRAAEEGWGILVRDPGEDDPVPTKVTNPKAVRIIQPVFDMLGTIPGYRELDISFFFLIFLTIFFAMIIGDGGYGLVLLGGSIWGAVKSLRGGKGLGQGILLLLVLSTATVLWGAITGNWFGYAPFAELPVLRNLVIQPLDAVNPASTLNVQWICFVLGTVHLSIAHGWKFIAGLRKRPRIRAFTDLGMLSMVLGLYYLVLQLVLDATRFPMPSHALHMILGGFIAVLLFSNQEKGQNFFLGIAKGFGGIITIALDSISAFSDIISYIRLFAVGLATLAIAQSFNGMALGISNSVGGLIGAVAAAMILFLGHTLNLAMGALSVIVHGVRLNMLEFSGHLGMEWTGVAYAPFQKRNSA